MIILDTNVVSEPSQPKPSPNVIAWLERQNSDDLYTTAVTEAESYYGLAQLMPGKRRDALEQALKRFYAERISGRVLPFDRVAAREFGAVAVLRRKAGRHAKIFDTQICAIARAHGAKIATRDVADFEFSGVELINPWTA